MDAKLSLRFGLDQNTLAHLHAKKYFTCKDVLSATTLELIHDLDLPYPQIQAIVKCVSKAITPAPASVQQRFVSKSEKMLKTGLIVLDAYLRGGIPSSSITEIVGASGVGKTHFTYMLAILATLPTRLGGQDDDSAAMFFCPGFSFSAPRIQEMASSMYPDEYALTDEDNDNLISILQRIIVEPIDNPMELAKRLDERQFEEMLISRKVKLIVVDSIAALARPHFDNESLWQRQQILTHIAGKLKYYAETLEIPVVVVNDTSKMQDRLATAALGTVWSHCVNTRLILESDDWEQYADANIVVDPDKPLKRFTIAKSPVSPVVSFPAVQTPSGFALIERQLSSQDDATELEKYFFDVSPGNYWEQVIYVHNPITGV